MGRAPCCDKAIVKKGPWSPEEDAKLKSYIEEHGTGGNWIALPQKIGLKRCGKSCRLRWLNYLRPNIKHGGFSEEEDNLICSLYISIGSRWSIIAAQLPGRTDNDIKNYWNTRLKKKLLGKQRKEKASRRSSANQKKEMLRKGSENYYMISTPSDHIPNIDNPNPYWPEIPVLPPKPYSNEEPRFNDHASSRKLLIKLGGRFSSDNDDDQTTNNGLNNNLQYPLGNYSMVQTLYDDQQISMLPAAPVEALNHTTTTLPDESQHNVDGADFSTAAVLGQSSLRAELEQMIYNNPQKLGGLEFFCGDMLMNNSGPIGSLDWGEMSSMVLPTTVASSYHGNLQQGALQDCTAIDHLTYPGTLGFRLSWKP